jgi:hypothetical protein
MSCYWHDQLYQRRVTLRFQIYVLIAASIFYHFYFLKTPLYTRTQHVTAAVQQRSCSISGSHSFSGNVKAQGLLRTASDRTVRAGGERSELFCSHMYLKFALFKMQYCSHAGAPCTRSGTCLVLAVHSECMQSDV